MRNDRLFFPFFVILALLIVGYCLTGGSFHPTSLNETNRFVVGMWVRLVAAVLCLAHCIVIAVQFRKTRGEWIGLAMVLSLPLTGYAITVGCSAAAGHSIKKLDDFLWIGLCAFAMGLVAIPIPKIKRPPRSGNGNKPDPSPRKPGGYQSFPMEEPKLKFEPPRMRKWWGVSGSSQGVPYN